MKTTTVATEAFSARAREAINYLESMVSAVAARNHAPRDYQVLNRQMGAVKDELTALEHRLWDMMAENRRYDLLPAAGLRMQLRKRNLSEALELDGREYVLGLLKTWDECASDEQRQNLVPPLFRVNYQTSQENHGDKT